MVPTPSPSPTPEPTPEPTPTPTPVPTPEPTTRPTPTPAPEPTPRPTPKPLEKLEGDNIPIDPDARPTPTPTPTPTPSPTLRPPQALRSLRGYLIDPKPVPPLRSPGATPSGADAQAPDPEDRARMSERWFVRGVDSAGFTAGPIFPVVRQARFHSFLIEAEADTDVALNLATRPMLTARFINGAAIGEQRLQAQTSLPLNRLSRGSLRAPTSCASKCRRAG